MKLLDNLDLVGKLTIKKIDKDNIADAEIVAHNDITLSGRRLVAQLFNPKDEAMKPVTQIKLGTGNKDFEAMDNDLAQPIEGHAIEIETADIQELEDNRIKLTLTGTLQENDEKVNGKELTEACLYSESEIMYNRVQFPAISKTENFKLTLIWEITF